MTDHSQPEGIGSNVGKMTTNSQGQVPKHQTTIASSERSVPREHKLVEEFTEFSKLVSKDGSGANELGNSINDVPSADVSTGSSASPQLVEPTHESGTSQKPTASGEHIVNEWGNTQLGIEAFGLMQGYQIQPVNAVTEGSATSEKPKGKINDSVTDFEE